MTPSPAIQREIGLFLWRGSLSERSAVAVFNRLQRGTFLTEAERAPLERFTDEETDHGNRLREAALKYLPTRPATGGVPFNVARMPEPAALALIGIGERLTIPGFYLARAFFDRIGDTEAVAAYDILIRDEPGHIDWTRGIMKRMRQDAQLAPFLLDLLRSRGLSIGYRAVKQDRRWLAEVAA